MSDYDQPQNILNDGVFNSIKVNDQIYTNNLIKGNYSYYKIPVVVATTSNIVLSGIQTINGVTLKYNDRVLVTAQNNQIENGIYHVSVPWIRTSDCLNGQDIAGCMVYSLGVEPYKSWNTFYVCTSAPSIVGTNPITFRNICIRVEPTPPPPFIPIDHDRTFVTSCAFDSQNNLYFTGSYGPDTTLHNRDGSIAFTLPNTGRLNFYNMFAVKMNSDGFVVGYTYLEIDFSAGSSILVDSSDNIYIVGTCFMPSQYDVSIKTFDYFPSDTGLVIPFNTTAATNGDLFIIKWNNKGTVSSYTYIDGFTHLDRFFLSSLAVYNDDLYLSTAVTKQVSSTNNAKIKTFSTAPVSTGYELVVPTTTVNHYTAYIIKWGSGGKSITYTNLGLFLTNSTLVIDPLSVNATLSMQVNSTGIYLGGTYRSDVSGNIYISDISPSPSATAYYLPCTSGIDYSFVIKWTLDGSVERYTYMESFYLMSMKDINTSLTVSGVYTAPVTLNTFSLSPTPTSTVISDQNAAIIIWENYTFDRYTTFYGQMPFLTVDGNDIYLTVVATTSQPTIYSISSSPVSTGLVIPSTSGCYYTLKWSNNSFSYFNVYNHPPATTRIITTGGGAPNILVQQASCIGIDSVGSYYFLSTYDGVYSDIPIYNQLTNLTPPTQVFPLTANIDPTVSLRTSSVVKWNSNGTVANFVPSTITNAITPGGVEFSIQVGTDFFESSNDQFFGSSNFLFNSTNEIDISVFYKDAYIKNAGTGNLVISTRNAKNFKNGADINLYPTNINVANSIDISSQGGTNSGNINFLTNNGINSSGGFILLNTLESTSNYISFTTDSTVNITSANDIYFNTIEYDSTRTAILQNTSKLTNGGLLMTKTTNTVSALSPAVTINSSQGMLTVTDVSLAQYASVDITVTNNNILNNNGDIRQMMIGIQDYTGTGMPKVQVRSISSTNFVVRLFNISTNIVNTDVTIAFFMS